MSVPLWTFHSNIDATRQESLLAWSSFENVVGALLLGTEVAAFKWRDASAVFLAGCHRAEFLLHVSPYTYDGFFNSPVGYRAQYAISAANGAARNRELIDSLQTLLLAAAEGSRSASSADIAASIAAPEAKVWIDEDEAMSHYIEEAPEIAFPRWILPEHSCGLRAPVGSRLVVLGGWVDQTGAIRPNPYKARRAEEIHEQGYS
jgi:hypothetical protein